MTEVWLPELPGGGVVGGEGSFAIGEVGGDRESGVGWRFSSRISSSKICIISWPNSLASKCWLSESFSCIRSFFWACWACWSLLNSIPSIFLRDSLPANSQYKTPRYLLVGGIFEVYNCARTASDPSLWQVRESNWTCTRVAIVLIDFSSTSISWKI